MTAPPSAMPSGLASISAAPDAHQIDALPPGRASCCRLDRPGAPGQRAQVGDERGDRLDATAVPSPRRSAAQQRQAIAGAATARVMSKRHFRRPAAALSAETTGLCSRPQLPQRNAAARLAHRSGARGLAGGKQWRRSPPPCAQARGTHPKPITVWRSNASVCGRRRARSQPMIALSGSRRGRTPPRLAVALPVPALGWHGGMHRAGASAAARPTPLARGPDAASRRTTCSTCAPEAGPAVAEQKTFNTIG